MENLNNGCLLAFEEIYNMYNGNLAFLCQKFLGNKEDVEEVVQDTFVIAFKKVADLKGDTLLPYLRKIAMYECFRKRNKNKNRQEYIIQTGTTLEDQPELNTDFLPAEALQNKELRTMLFKIINNLPKKRREMIYLYYYAGLSTKEIAHLYNCTDSTVYNTLSAARNTIKSKLEGKYRKKAIPIAVTSVVSLGAVLLLEEQVFATGYTNMAGTGTSVATKSATAFFIIAVCVVTAVIASAATHFTLRTTEDYNVYQPPETIYETYIPALDDVTDEESEDIYEDIDYIAQEPPPPEPTDEEPDPPDEPYEESTPEHVYVELPEVIIQPEAESQPEPMEEPEPVDEPEPEEIYEPAEEPIETAYAVILPPDMLDNICDQNLTVSIPLLPEGASATIISTRVASNEEDGNETENTARAPNNLVDKEDDEVITAIVPNPPTIKKRAGAYVNGAFVPTTRAIVGDTITYTLTVNNPNAQELNGPFTIIDLLPPYLTFVNNTIAIYNANGNSSAWTVDYLVAINNNALTIVLNRLPACATTITFDVVINALPPANANDEYIAVNTVHLYEDINEPPIDTCADEYEVVEIPEPSVSIVKTAPETVDAGATVGYTIRVMNTGDVDLMDLVIEDELPPQLTFVPSSMEIVGSVPEVDITGYDANGQLLGVYLALLAVGAYVDITFNVVVAAELPGGTVITNTATVTGEAEAGTPVEDDDTARTTINYPPTFYVTLTKTAITGTEVLVGERILYAIVIENTGNVVLENLSVTDQLPLGLINPDKVSLPLGVTGEWSNTAPYLFEGIIANLPINANVTILLSAEVALETNGELVNTATVTGSYNGTLVESSDTEIVTVNDPPSEDTSIELIIEVSDEYVLPGDDLTYTIIVTNTGDIPLTGLLVTDNLPEQLINPRYLALPTGATGDFTGNLLEIVLTSLAPGASFVITFTTTVATGTAIGTSIINTAFVADTRTGVGSNDSATVTVTTEPDAYPIKNPDRTVVRVGETINWTLRGFQNRSGGTVSNFTIVDIPSRGLNFLSGCLPAFTNGADITFDIRYTVAGSDEWHIFATGVDASQPFSFSLPQSGSLHYTNIGFFFGDVHADFGIGNEIILTFIVGVGAPNNTLSNRFTVQYDNLIVQYNNLIAQYNNTEREGRGTANVVPEVGNDEGSYTHWTLPTDDTPPATQDRLVIATPQEPLYCYDEPICLLHTPPSKDPQDLVVPDCYVHSCNQKNKAKT